MGICTTCGNEYDKTFTVIKDQVDYDFDSFECAIEKLAPRCAHCDCRVIGHGVEKQGTVYCCAHCASQAGDEELVDRV